MKRVVSSGLRFTVPARKPTRGSGDGGVAESVTDGPPADTDGDSELLEPPDAHDAANAAPASTSADSGAALQREPSDRCFDSGFTFKGLR